MDFVGITERRVLLMASNPVPPGPAGQERLLEKLRLRMVAIEAQFAIIDANGREDIRLDRREFRDVLTSEADLLTELRAALVHQDVSAPAAGVVSQLDTLQDAIQQLSVSQMSGAVNGVEFSYVLVRRAQVHELINNQRDALLRPVAEPLPASSSRATLDGLVEKWRNWPITGWLRGSVRVESAASVVQRSERRRCADELDEALRDPSSVAETRKET